MNGQPERPDVDANEETPEPQDAETAQTENDSESRDDTAAALAELQAKADENWDLYLRAAAETENVRKRTARDVEQARKYALENFGKEMIGVRDSLEMGIAAAENADAGSLLQGSEATLKLLTTALERFGFAEIDPEGEPFDPERHEAMTLQPSATAEPGSVLTVIQKGYTLNGRLIRPARVIVAAEPPEGGGEE